MPKSQTLNPSEPQNKLLSKSSNFLNSQNYILGKGEKKRVLSSFLGTEILKKVLGYTMIFSSILFIIFSFILIYLKTQYIVIGIIFAIIGILSLKKHKVNTIYEYFFIYKENVLNTILLIFSISLILLIGFQYLVVNIKDLYGVNYALIFSGFFILFTFFLSSLYKNYIVNTRFIYLNILNILLIPLIFPLGLILYSIIYLKSSIQEYKIIKFILIKNSLLNFNEITKGIFTNGYYEITKK